MSLKNITEAITEHDKYVVPAVLFTTSRYLCESFLEFNDKRPKSLLEIKNKPFASHFPTMWDIYVIDILVSIGRYEYTMLF